MKVAYFIMAHQRPKQLQRLINSIHTPDNLYLVHLDSKADDEMFTVLQELINKHANIFFLPSRSLTWGGWSLVQVEIDAIRLLLSDPTWTHYINLSGQDFPLVDQKKISQILKPGISYMDYHQNKETSAAYTSKYYIEDCGQMKVLGAREPFENYFVAGYEQYRASQWKILSRSAAEHSVQSPLAYQMQDYFRHSLMSDESYFPTLLLNSDFPVENENYRFLNMKQTPEGFFRPDTLTQAYLPHLEQSKALFARKFDDQVDESILSILESRLEV